MRLNKVYRCVSLFIYVFDHTRNNWFPANNSSGVKKPNVFQLFKILAEGKAVPEEMMVEVIVGRLKSPDVQHYGEDKKQLK